MNASHRACIFYYIGKCDSANHLRKNLLCKFFECKPPGLHFYSSSTSFGKMIFNDSRSSGVMFVNWSNMVITSTAFALHSRYITSESCAMISFMRIASSFLGLEEFSEVDFDVLWISINVPHSVCVSWLSKSILLLRNDYDIIITSRLTLGNNLCRILMEKIEEVGKCGDFIC